MRVAVLGAGGTVGGSVAELLEARRIPWHPADRGATSQDLGTAAVLIAAVGGDVEAARRSVRAAIEGGIDVVDVDPETGYLRWLHDLATALGPPRGARVVGAAGLRWAIGDLLTALAAEQVRAAEIVHVAYTAGGSRRRPTPGQRRSAIAGLGEDGAALQDGRWVPEPPGALRRLAWFPRPVGPSHAVAVAGGEALTVPRHLPSVATVHTYEAMPGWQAELLQARANLARTARGRRWLQRRLAADRRAAQPAVRADQRWGCVAEVVGGRTLGRAWAYGHDPVALTASLAVEFALRLATTTVQQLPGGPVTPSELAPPGVLLDRLADAGGLRWSRSSTTLEDH